MSLGQTEDIVERLLAGLIHIAICRLTQHPELESIHLYNDVLALVVPPTANLQTNYGWGVASSRISRIEHQFQRNFPGHGMFGGPFRPTPVWPSDTSQFGVYYVRGPW